MFAVSEQPEYPGNRNKDGVISNYVVLFLKDGRNINLTSYNAPSEKGARHTRQKPIFSVTELVALARDKAWNLPPVYHAAPTGKPSTK